MIIANIYMYIAHISNLQITIALMYCIKMLCKLIVQVQSVYRITLLCCERPHSERKDHKMVHGVTIVLRKASQWQKWQENGPWCYNRAAVALWWQKRTIMGPWYHHRAAVGLVVTDKTTKDPWCHQTAVERLTVTKKTTNCPWHHHSAVEGLAVKEETRKCFVVSPSCCGRPHGDIKDHKMVHGVAIVLQKSLRWQKRPKKWFNVSPSCCRRLHSNRKDHKMAYGVTFILRKASQWQKRTEIDP